MPADWIAGFEGREALAVGVSRCGRGVAVLTATELQGAWDGAEWRVPLKGRAPRGFAHHDVVWGPDGRVVAGSVGAFALVDGRTGARLERFTRDAHSGVVRRGLLAGDRVVLDEGTMRVLDLRSGEVALEMRPEVSFMGSQNAAAVDPTGSFLAVGGVEGMDAGWSERFDLATGASLSRSGSGYAIDAVELDPEGGLLYLDDYLGLAGFRHTGDRVSGNDLWLVGDVLFVAHGKGVTRLEQDGPRADWAVSWPTSLSVGDDGLVAVVSGQKVRFHSF
ncbi:MAG: hypothetical protein H6737_29650 [Alphaproteobacteria bacterium]|nr:hypothetical protein [Alphaproteobacteria bacterium]